MSRFGTPQEHVPPWLPAPYNGDATLHSRESRPPAPVGQHVEEIVADPSEIFCPAQCTGTCIPYWAIQNNEISMLQDWLTKDGINVGRRALLDLLTTCLLDEEEAMAQLILKVGISPPLDISYFLRAFIQDLRRPQVEIALRLGAKMNDVLHEDMLRVFSAENCDVALLFLKKGLNPDLHYIKKDTTGAVSLLWAACTRRDTVVLKALIKAGADMRLIGQSAQRTDILPSRPFTVDPCVPYYMTPLAAAALMSSHLSCLKFLLDHKYVQPDINGVDMLLLHDVLRPRDVPTPFIWLKKKGADRGYLESFSDEPLCDSRNLNTTLNCLEMLLDHGLDPNSLCLSKSSNQPLPMLSAAAGDGNIKAMSLLLDKGALIDIRPFGKDTALLHALQCAQLGPNSSEYNSQLQAALHLVRVGANVAPGNKTAATAIHMAIFLQSFDVLNDLLESMKVCRPSKYTRMDEEQYIKYMINRGYLGTATALIQAIECGKLDLVQHLLKYGADVHQSDRLGRTAIMMAAQQLRRHAGPYAETEKAHRAQKVAENICKQLLLHGANPDERNDVGHDAYDYAGDEEPRFAALVKKATSPQGETTGDDGMAADGQNVQAASAVVEGDTRLDVERAQETVVEGGGGGGGSSRSSRSRPRKRGKAVEQADSTAKRRRVG